MNVANLENCKKLYKLSGWTPEASLEGVYNRSSSLVYGHKILLSDGDTPAYDTDYLLDKLTEVKTGLTLYHNHSLMQWECFYAGKFFEYEEEHWDTMTYSKADAACLLACKLFETGILKKETKEN